MTTIDRLGLIGIRSYGTDEETFIKFYKPLTIILGRNGSGKSTIIEAVKMATTGDLPPMVDKGAAFIHDPRIHNETETKAKIRLLFTNVRGDQYVVSRHFQLSLKKGPRGIGYKTEFKTLDQTVKRMDGGAASSYLNALLPDIMRVTKPVLNNVIFVHQEDSLWPLGDSKKLKEKFDEIFAATRYTKALDTIRKFRKDQAADMKTVNVELMHYEDKVQALEKVRSEVDEIRVRHDELRQGVDALDNEIAGLTSERDAVNLIAKDYDEQCGELEKLKIEGDIIESDKAEKYSEMQLHLPNMDEDALATEIDELEVFLERADGERSKRGKLIQDLVADTEMKRAEFHTRQNRKGRLEQLVKMQAERKSRLEAMKEEFLTADSFAKGKTASGETVSLPPRCASVANWTEALNALHRDADENVKAASRTCDKKLDAASAHLNDAKGRLHAAKSTCERKSEEVIEKRGKISGIRVELRTLDDSHASIKEAESKLKAVERMWKEKSAGTHAEELEEEITAQKKEVSSRREDHAILRRTREQLVENQSEHARYDLCREAETKKKKRVEGVIEDFSEILASAITELGEEEDSTLLQLRQLVDTPTSLTTVNADGQINNLFNVSNKVLARKDSFLQQAERHQSDMAATAKSTSMRRVEMKAQLCDATGEMQAVEKEIRAVSASIASIPNTGVDIDHVAKLLRDCQVSSGLASIRFGVEQLEPIQESLEAVENAVVKANQKISQLESGVLLAEEELTTFEEDPKHRCPACGLTSSKKVGDMRRNLKSRVEYLKDPESSRLAEEELLNLGHTSRALKKVHSIGLKACSRLSALEATKSKLDEADVAFRDCQKSASEVELSLENLKQRFGVGSAMEQIASKRLELKQAYGDWERAMKEVATVKATLAGVTSESRSLSEVDGEIGNLEERVQKLQDDIDKNSRALQRERDDLRRLEIRFHQSKQHCLELQSMAEKHKRLQQEKEDLSKSVRTLESEIETLRSSLKGLKQDMEYAEEEFVTVRAENGMALREANAVLSKRKMDIHRWNDCLSDIEAFNRSGKEQELENLLTSLKTIEADIESQTTDLRAHEKEQQTASDSQKDMESKIRNLRDNQRFRIQERKLQVNARSSRHVQDEISALERRAGGDPSQKEAELTAQINSKNAMRSATLGKRQVFTERYKEKKKDLVDAEEQGSRRKFDECRIRKQTMELASSDLEKYHRALDQALMAFHTLKMNSINRTIKDLWQQTYRGTDIDEIEINSDHGDPRSVAGGALKRTFNYRVQMRQGQATLDMRGRCSAGQKVLACLVIRLALAESFCTDCGILALDEPTTNLDRENIESLAAALKTIIESRRKQRNFQLVLITHDQEFIDMIGARDFCNEYFMIFKDMQGISRARVQDLQEM